MNLSKIKYRKIFPCSEIKEIDKYTIENEQISSLDLMERAASSLYVRLTQLYESRYTTFKIFAGTGNNGGDAIAVARMLYNENYNVEVYLVNISKHITQETEININRFKNINKENFHEIKDSSNLPAYKKGDVIVDGIFGAGLSRVLENGVIDIVHSINSSGCDVVSIDIPTGLFGEDNSNNLRENIVKAKHTLSLEFPKLSFLFPENEIFLGEISIVPIGLNEEIILRKEVEYKVINNEYIADIIRPISRFAYKGSMGRALIVSGQDGMLGCSILAGRAAIRSGVGLLTIHTPMHRFEMMHLAIPEALLSIDKDKKCITEIDNVSNYNSIGVGSGIGTRQVTVFALHDLLKQYNHPMVLDADAINIISSHIHLLEHVPHNSIFTPHIGEFDNLVGASNTSFERLQKQRDFAQKRGMVVVLKGAYTSIASPQGKIYFNSTGNQGMATAGSGDVLTGILTALLAQGYEPLQAAKIGVYIHGLAGDLAAKEKGYHGLIASDIVEFLPYAWKEVSNYSNFV